MQKKKIEQEGYIALISVVIISLLLVTIGLALSFEGFLSRFNILNNEYKKLSVDLAEACADRAILEIAQDSSYTIAPTTDCSGGRIIKVGSEQCAICSIGANPLINENMIKAQASTTASTLNTVYTNLEVKISTSTDNIEIKSWKEVPNL